MDQLAPVAVIQVACGFKREPLSTSDYEAMSRVDDDRASKVNELVRPLDTVFVTGMVPYTSAYPKRTLAALNTNRLIDRYGLDTGRILSVRGLNAYSESWHAVRLAQEIGVQKITVIASDFYFLAYKRLWLAAARRSGLVIELITLTHPDVDTATVGKFYASVPSQLLSRLAASSHIGHLVAMNIADHLTSYRATRGFTFDGHTRIV
jgi:hypothetical protein